MGHLLCPKLVAALRRDGLRKTYGKLAKAEGHLLSITSNLNKNLTVITEGCSDGSCKRFITLGLEKAFSNISKSP
jgi:hypothetical protein